MYRRFLNNNDYLAIITEEALTQLTRGREECFPQAEEAAEASIVEYLTDNYEIEKELEIGKRLLEYSPKITYPVGSHFYYNGKIAEALRSINGLKAPATTEYWMLVETYDKERFQNATQYSQVFNYRPGDIVLFNNEYFECLDFNGMDYNDIRIPGVVAWEEVETFEWEPNLEYRLWETVQFEDDFYTLIDVEDVDLTVNPRESDKWGMIGNYIEDYTFELSPHEYVVKEGKVYYPVMLPNPDELKEGYNFRYHDPRNSNVKKHLVRLALYELHKLVSPNNVSTSRIADFEASMAWLHDANRCKINPQIPRKIGEDRRPVTEVAIATFMRDYDPYKNPWQV